MKIRLLKSLKTRELLKKRFQLFILFYFFTKEEICKMEELEERKATGLDVFLIMQKSGGLTGI